MEKREVIYNGESVKIYGTDVPEEILVCFTDSITAFNKIKKASIADKDMLNAGIAAMIFRILDSFAAGWMSSLSRSLSVM